MRSFTLFLILLLSTITGVLAQPRTPAPSPLFDDQILPSIRIEMAPEDLRFILADENAQSDVEFPARFTFDGGFFSETVEQVGFRIRGNTSRTSAQKKSFKVSFNTFVAGQKLYGIEKLNLNGEHNDPSIIRSKLSWDLFQQMGLPASRANHVKLFINGTYFGLYINVEQVDEQFLESRFGNSTGNLYKCLYPADLTYRGASASNYLPGSDRRPYDLKLKDSDDEGYDDLARFINVLNNTSDALFPSTIETVFNVNSFLQILAVEVATGSWDGYWVLKNNFYLYFDPETELAEFIPFDYDNTFGIWWDVFDPPNNWGDQDVYTWGHPTEPRPLTRRILAVPKFRARFTFYLKQLLEGPFAPDQFLPHIDERYGLISGAIPSDPYRPLDYGYTVQAFHDSYTQALGGHVRYGLKPYVTTRHASALIQLEGTNVAPILSSPQVRPLRPQTSDPIKVMAFIQDEDFALTVEARYRLDGGSETVLPMFDDGAHGDDVAGDGWWSTSLPPAGRKASLNIRVYARDTDGQESFSFPAIVEVGYDVPPLFINEFMAGNLQTIADESGAFPDWIELYNGGSETLSLRGYFLTDDLARPDRWALPDTTLPGGGFLLLWADDDQEEGPLHTTFQLNRAGEQLGLFNADLAPIDTFTFGPQETDVSEGRMVDGGPSFIRFNPATPGAPNHPGIVGTESDPDFGTGITLIGYPNPFSAILTLDLTLPHLTQLDLDVFDLLGRRVRRIATGVYPEGEHRFSWDGLLETGRQASPGLYLLRLHSANAGNRSLPVILTR